ncbi:hypothetical protein ACH5RR_026495 [Cinchona calisaya]|uniref:Uncharacterized protein n=1 Tax=Cinchona calisaya TaxID=153742 RepID=A0ABD2Z2Q5_9GENT
MRSGFPRSPSTKKDDLNMKNGNKGIEAGVGGSQLVLKEKEVVLEKAEDLKLNRMGEIMGSQGFNNKDTIRSTLPREDGGNRKVLLRKMFKLKCVKHFLWKDKSQN